MSLNVHVSDPRLPTVAAELAAINVVRLTRGTPAISEAIADKGGIRPLVWLLAPEASAGAQNWAAAAIAELALVPKNRDLIATAGGIKRLSKLLVSPAMGTPEVAARAIAHLALSDSDDGTSIDAGSGSTPVKRQPAMGGGVGGGDKEEKEEETGPVHGSDERRAVIEKSAGVQRLISMIDGANLNGVQVIPIGGLSVMDCRLIAI